MKYVLRGVIKKEGKKTLRGGCNIEREEERMDIIFNLKICVCVQCWRLRNVIMNLQKYFCKDLIFMNIKMNIEFENKTGWKI